MYIARQEGHVGRCAVVDGEEDMENKMSRRLVHILTVLLQGSVITAGVVTMGKDTRTKRSLASAFLSQQSI